VLAAVALPATAGAATPVMVEPLKACYRSVDATTREVIVVRAEGFTPGAKVEVIVDGHQVSTQADTDGHVVGEVAAPYQARGARPFDLTLTEPERPANTVSARAGSRRSACACSRARPARAGACASWGSASPTVPEVFAHYVRAGKVRRTVSLGATRGACGRINLRRPQIPVRRPATGRWVLQADNLRAYDPEPSGAHVRVAIKVFKRPRR
jgi:hypothetical protein